MASEDTVNPEALVELGIRLIQAAKNAPLSTISALLEQGAPAWYQDENLGWSPLHYAAERREPKALDVLLKGGAVWNAVDKWGRTAGEICLSLGDEEGWLLIRNEGIRSEMLHHALAGASAGLNNIILRAEDSTSAGDNLVFLKSQLTWDVGKDGKERVLDADGNGVMMGWEEPLMVEHVRYLTEGHPKMQLGEEGEGMSILNVGFGLGIVDRLFQTCDPKPSHHTIIEAHPQVLEYIRQKGIHLLPNVRILEGRWQDWLLDGDKIGEVLSGTPNGMGFDAIFVDTFAEGYEVSDLKAFFEVIPDILDAENGRFSFWNGLGATNPTIYAVASSLAELHLEDVGLNVEWHDVAIPESMREEVWKDVRRRYWDLPGYRLPIGKMSLF
ncbi:arginine N-methyltransferase 2 [Cryptococcus wingfieldii CBS 7118]|uniref:Arginine N-methyltransferase 2 n=1 Tax=Cryptococcus wingfieldii CBS 7118 TaxID=1295528 RepID=A0A1E3IM41_9TREE|nr:arginine N-methyltransferase 2 [Cryptococcus wingfieldii CBS 7118]ODN89667.1 arginine N-methyltransferase 2 [Cryptococcus wingfieldii CBS 7118]